MRLRQAASIPILSAHEQVYKIRPDFSQIRTANVEVGTSKDGVVIKYPHKTKSLCERIN